MSARTVAFPVESRLHARLAEAHYADAFESELRDPGLTPTDIARTALQSTPPWVGALMRLRDALVRPLGLKTTGRLASAMASAPAVVGDRFSIFTVRSSDPAELVIGIDDSHLDVRISFLKRMGATEATYVVSSWVKTHNALGRLYMLPVAPFHRLIVTLMMRGVAI